MAWWSYRDNTGAPRRFSAGTGAASQSMPRQHSRPVQARGAAQRGTGFDPVNLRVFDPPWARLTKWGKGESGTFTFNRVTMEAVSPVLADVVLGRVFKEHPLFASPDLRLKAYEWVWGQKRGNK